MPTGHKDRTAAVLANLKKRHERVETREIVTDVTALRAEVHDALHALAEEVAFLKRIIRGIGDAAESVLNEAAE